MGGSRIVTLAVLAVAAAPYVRVAEAGRSGLPETPGALVAVSVEVDGEAAPLYPAPDGSGRFYVEAHEGRPYSVTLANRSALRLGVVLTVDGLNVVSGGRDEGRGRMYVLDPWQTTAVRGWRTSLQSVRRFTFVDERVSYAARSGKANAKMGWIEVAVYRERRLYQPQPMRPEGRLGAPAEGESADAGESAPAKRRYESAPRDEEPAPSAGARSYPGTGWGRREQDPVVLVSFEPEPSPAQCTTLRYEYRPALVALGVLPRHRPLRDRLWEREHADSGFAEPPLW